MSKKVKYLEILSPAKIDDVLKPIQEAIVKETPKETIVEEVEKLNQDNSWRLTQYEIEALVGNVFEGREPHEGFDEEQWQPSPLESFRLKLRESILGFFCDRTEKPYVIFKHDEIQKYFPIREDKFREHLQALYWQKAGKAMSKVRLNEIIEELAAEATFTKETKKRVILNNRVALADDKFIYSLGNDEWQAVEVSSEGWRIINEPPMFKRHKHQKPQVIPASNGLINDLLQFLPEDRHILLLVDIIANFIPGIAKPLLAIFGDHGSGKSTLARLIQNLIDPTDHDLTDLSSEKKELAQLLDQNYAITIDNISQLKGHQSDMLCRAVTGGSFQKRKLNTDSETVGFNFQNCIILNGIDCVIQKPDLLDRSLLIELQRLDESEVKTDSDIEGKFHESLPVILGGIFNVLAKAKKIHSEVKLTSLPRMAEFAKWGYAIAEVLGIGGEKFIELYNENLGGHHFHVAENNQVMSSVFHFIASTPEKKWSGRVSDLLAVLNSYNKETGIIIDKKEWPKSDSWLSRELNKLKVSFKGVGIKLDVQRTGTARRIIIERIMNNMPSSASQEPEDVKEPVKTAKMPNVESIDIVGKEMTEAEHVELKEPRNLATLKITEIDDGNDGNEHQKIIAA